ncbi:MAG: peptide chain release factor 1 [Saprospiraceae bacterium]|nr:peptide chain release factor 1 [Saprospiraceae bacterium]MDW8483210.1 peptide chain release factor 1 [Saprospiraceae bacterium]
MRDKLEAIRDKYLHLEEQLADPTLAADVERFRKLNKEYKKLQPIVATYERYKKVLAQIDSAREVLEVESDPEMRQMAREEIDTLQVQLEALEGELKELLIPRDPEDEKDVIFEIRAGTGGDEAALFAGDLYRMYMRYFQRQGWEVEVVDESPGTVGGFSKVILEVRGENVYSRLKFESGIHRVQRVPETEAKGRIHTSAASVAVLPIIEPEEINIRKEDLRRDVFRSSGAGGQHVNRTESGVRYTHLPTGLVAESTESRSQHKNSEIALGRLLQQLREMQLQQQRSALAMQRRSLVGSGDRSEKIRTYNWPQNRVTDHRLEGEQKNFNLDKIIEGELDELIEALTVADHAAKLQTETV